MNRKLGLAALARTSIDEHATETETHHCSKQRCGQHGAGRETIGGAGQKDRGIGHGQSPEGEPQIHGVHLLPRLCHEPAQIAGIKMGILAFWVARCPARYANGTRGLSSSAKPLPGARGWDKKVIVQTTTNQETATGAVPGWERFGSRCPRPGTPGFDWRGQT